jgi:N-acetylated-alpha-linked acidic dipeptidase
MDMPVRPGDPLTPDYGATKDAKRLDLKDAETIMKIPVLPISYEDALPFLQSLGGEPVPAAWRGGLPITYHVGPSKDKVHLKLEFNWDQKPLYDVIAKIPGSQLPDEWVIRGNHHDGWVNGATDPLSGMVAELSEAKAIGDLYRTGYRPKRTLVYCAWDGEEPALLGSTEWTEDHQQELKQKAVAYINSDGNGRGFVGASGSHTLETFFNEITDNVMDPETGVTIKDRHYAHAVVNADAATRSKMLDSKDSKHIKLGALGAGSDYSPFLQHLGIASLNLGFGGEDPGGEYHSIFDSYDLFKKFKDPDFAYGVTLSKTAGRIMLRLADADVLPFDFDPLYKTVNDYVTEVKKLLDDERLETNVQNKIIKEKLFDLAKDPKKTFVTPKLKEDVPYLNFSSLDNALVGLRENAEEFQKMYSDGQQMPVAKQNELNDILYKAERSLIEPNGLPRRPWYKHEIYAPGYYTGYGVKTLPGIREAIEQKNWKEAQDNEELVANAITKYNQQVQQAIDVVKKNTDKKSF